MKVGDLIESNRGRLGIVLQISRDTYTDGPRCGTNGAQILWFGIPMNWVSTSSIKRVVSESR